MTQRLTERFPDRYAGAAFLPLKVTVRESDSSLRDLTGDTATFTIRPVDGSVAVVSAAAHTNTPGAAGEFLFQPAAAQVSTPGEYEVKVVMMFGGVQDVDVYGLRILRA